MEGWIVFFVVALAAAFFASTIKAPKTKAAALEDFDIPTADDGRPIPVVFGTYTVTGSNCVWYGDLGVETETEDHVKTRKYSLGLHFAICHGPVDALTQIRVSDKEAWVGEQTASGTISIDKGSLFGGKRESGGVVGDLDVMMGEAAQTPNSYLSSVQSGPQPAYRGVLSLVANQMYVTANNPSIGPWAFRVRRILEGWYNDTCWYPETAPIGQTVDFPYDEYAESLALTNWWKLSSSSNSHVNVGSASTPLVGYYGVSTPSTDAQIATGEDHLTEATQDASAVRFVDDADSAFLQADTTITGPFVIGVWCQLEAGVSNAAVLQTGFISSASNYRGMFLILSSDGSLTLQFGNGGGVTAAHRKTYQSSGGVVSDPTERHFIVVRCNASSSVASLTWAVLVDGAEATLSDVGGTATSVDWTGGSVHFGRISMTFAAYAYQGRMDEPFLHFGSLSDAEILELYTRGITPAEGAREDMNPAHIIYQALTDPRFALGEPTARVNNDSFVAAADTFYAEALGLSLIWNRQSLVGDFIEQILDHAGAVLYVDPSTGQWKLLPIRGDYDPDTLDSFDEDDIIEVETFERPGYGETVNEVVVVYRDRETGKDASSPPIQNLANIQAQGAVVNDTIQYPGIPTAALAARVAMRDLKAQSTPTAKLKVTLKRTAWDMHPGKPIKISWSKLGLSSLICRVAEIDNGTLTDGKITLSLVEDVFGLPDSVYAEQETSGWVEPDFTAVAVTIQDALEIPYHWMRAALGAAESAAMPDDAGFGRPLARKPQGLAIGYDLWGRIDPADYAEIALDAEWFYTALLNGAIDRETTTLTIDAGNIATDLVGPGFMMLVGTGRTAEWMRITGGNLTTTITVDRAILDTTPQEHADNTRVWVMPAEFVLYDETQYEDGDQVDYKVLTRTGSDVLAIGSATAVSVTMDSRQVRPYPPGDAQINGEGYPTLLAGPLTVTWAHRDRTAHVIVTQAAAGVGPEAGTTYDAYAYDDDTDALLDSDTGLSGTTWSPVIVGTRTVRIEIESMRDGFEAWQRQVRVFEYLDGDALLDADGDYLLDADGENIQEA